MKEERKQQRMNDDNNEFSAAKKMREGEKKHKEEVCLLSEHMCMFIHCVYHKGRQGEKKLPRIKKRDNERAPG